jgi:hypothetical protein
MSGAASPFRLDGRATHKKRNGFSRAVGQGFPFVQFLLDTGGIGGAVGSTKPPAAMRARTGQGRDRLPNCPDPVRQGRRRSAASARYSSRHAGSGQGLPCRRMAQFTPGQAAVVRDRRRLPVPTTGSPDYRTVCSPTNEPSRKYPAWLVSRPDRVRKRAPDRNIRDSIS